MSVICVGRLHRKLTEFPSGYRSWRKNHNRGLYNWLIFLVVVFSSLSYARSAVRGPVPASLDVSKAANLVETVTVMMDLDEGPATYRATGFLHSFSPTTPSD